MSTPEELQQLHQQRKQQSVQSSTFNGSSDAVRMDSAHDRFKAVERGDARPQPTKLDDEEIRLRRLVNYMVHAFSNLNLVTSLPTHNEPGYWSDPIDVWGEQQFIAGAITTWVDVASFEVPPGRWVRVEQYGVDVTDDSPSAYGYDGTIEFRMRVGDDSVPGLNAFSEQRGSGQRPRRTFFLASGEDSTRHIRFQARKTNTGANIEDVTLNFRGWMWRPLNNDEGPSVSRAP